MLSSSGAHLGVFARFFFCFFGLYRRILSIAEGALVTVVDACEEQVVEGVPWTMYDGVSTTVVAQTVIGAKVKQPVPLDREVNKGDALAQDVGVKANLPVGSTDLLASDLGLGDDEIVDDT
ncbi:hypothetical protein ACOSP7_004897 [Xanthoceras sorbifolium]